MLIALIPIGLALSAGHFPFKRVGLDWFVGVFGLTAILGLWAAYDPTSALQKFLILITSILLCYALAAQKKGDEQLIGFLLVFLGCTISAAFLWTHDWRIQPADYEWINRLGRSWEAIRPLITTWRTAPNRVGGVLATLLPFAIAMTLANHPFSKSTSSKWGQWILVLLACFFIAFGLLMSSSRGAWLSLILASVLWIVALVYSRFQARIRASARRLLRVSMMLLGLVVIILILSQFQTLVQWFDRLPGLASGHSRAEIASNSLRLVLDFPFTGGGLMSFPGLYSQYIQSIPFYLYGYSHNFYLDLAIEQGIIGFGSLVVIFGVTLFVGLRNINREDSAATSLSLLRHATLVALMTMILHGFVDDAFYGEKGTPLVFLFPGLTLYLASENPGFLSNGHSLRRYGKSALAVVAVVALGLVWIFPKAQSYWYSNLAAVQMAKLQLNDFPSGRWQLGAGGGEWGVAERMLLQAFEQNRQNRPAAYRLGLIAMLRMDFTNAVDFLTDAYQMDPGHRGVIKNLGYCYVWIGQPNQALSLLKKIPEARQELEAYSGWWRLHGRLDLAEKAIQMVERLQ